MSAAASRSPEATSAAAPAGRRRSTSSAAPSPDHPRAQSAYLVEVVGEAGGGRLRGHERVSGGEVGLHRLRHRAAAHHRAAEDHRPARGRRRRDARSGHLGGRGHHELDGVLQRLAGAREQDVRGAGADVDGEHASGPRAVARLAAPARRPPALVSRRRSSHGRRRPARLESRCRTPRARRPQAGCRVGTPLKRSFQTLTRASRKMSPLILLSPTLRSTKMMGSSTTLKPSLCAR